MAVLADGWHMSSHTLALGLSAFAYSYRAPSGGPSPRTPSAPGRSKCWAATPARMLPARHRGAHGFPVARAAAASRRRSTIDEAIASRSSGSAVNLICAWWLRGGHTHGHEHDHAHGARTRARRMTTSRHQRHEHALRLRARAGRCGHVGARDRRAAGRPAAGAPPGSIPHGPRRRGAGGGLGLGAAARLGRILLDAEMDAPVVAEVRAVIEQGAVPATITDLHVWRVGRAKYAVVLSVATPSDKDARIFPAGLVRARRTRARHGRSAQSPA